MRDEHEDLVDLKGDHIFQTVLLKFVVLMQVLLSVSHALTSLLLIPS